MTQVAGKPRVNLITERILEFALYRLLVFFCALKTIKECIWNRPKLRLREATNT